MNPTTAEVIVQMTDVPHDELLTIEGGADWCGTMLPNHGMPQYPLPRPDFDSTVKLA